VDFIDSMMVKIALIGLLGIGAQWIAWRTGRPAIALMMLAGLVAGPVTGVIVPERDFGPLLEPIIKLAVAVILFDGGLSLNFRDLRASKAGRAVLGLVVVGVPVGWALGTAAAYYGGGLPLAVAALFGGIMVVTGPTVIGPLLRNLNIGRRPAQILRWEGIVNDPIGALLAVFIFAWITYEGTARNVAEIAAEVAIATGIAAALGVAVAMMLTWLFRRGLVPEYLKAPVLLVSVIASFVAADLIYHETGLVTVTVMGVVIANSRLYEFESLRRFKEDLGVLLVSGVFILLPATLDWVTLRAFELRFLLFLVLLLFVVRPLTVMASLLFSGVPWRERAFVAWIGPRGVVAVAISGLFALRLEEHGVPGAEALIPLSFGVVVATIVAHGFTANAFARRLGIDQGEGRGLLLVGANPWTIALGRFLAELGVEVTVADDSRLALRPAVREGLAVYRGDILSEVTDDLVDLSRFQQLVAATGSPARNALICTDLGPEMGYHAVAQIGVDDERPPLHHRGRVLLEDQASIESLVARHEAGWRFRRTELTERFTFGDKKATMEEGSLLVAVLKPDGRLLFFGSGAKPAAETGDVLISFAPPAR
jgi:NhaP-type Na+/H+ or K+/H+ antiporter